MEKNIKVSVDISFNPNEKLEVTAKLMNFGRNNYLKYNKLADELEYKQAHQKVIIFHVDNIKELNKEDLSQFETVSIQNIV